MAGHTDQQQRQEERLVLPVTWRPEYLERDGILMSIESVAAKSLAATGPFSKLVDGFSPRAEQQEMATLISYLFIQSSMKRNLLKMDMVKQLNPEK